MIRYPKHLLQLIESLKRLPGVGNKTAERFAFQMLDWNAETLSVMAALIQKIPDKKRKASHQRCDSSPASNAFQDCCGRSQLQESCQGNGQAAT